MINRETDYTIQKMDNSEWVKLYKQDEFICSAIDADSAMHKVWNDNGKPFDYFYAVDDECEVYCINRGEL